jgi:hypothetical protein
MTPEILSNLDIEDLCYEFDIPLQCCCCKDELKEYTPLNGCYVVNLQNSDKPGSHWVALYIHLNNAIYFDPFGEIYPYEIYTFTKNKNLLFNHDTIQNLEQQCCGYYCIDFLNFMHTKTNKNMRKALNLFLSQFSDDTHENDNILQKHIKLLMQNKL